MGGGSEGGRGAEGDCDVSGHQVRGQAGVGCRLGCPPGPVSPPRPARGPPARPCCPPCHGSPFEEQAPWPSGVPGLGLLRGLLKGSTDTGGPGGLEPGHVTRPVARGPSERASRAVPASQGGASPREGGLLVHPAGWDVTRATGRGGPLATGQRVGPRGPRGGQGGAGEAAGHSARTQRSPSRGPGLGDRNPGLVSSAMAALSGPAHRRGQEARRGHCPVSGLCTSS